MKVQETYVFTANGFQIVHKADNRYFSATSKIELSKQQFDKLLEAENIMKRVVDVHKAESERITKILNPSK